MTNFPIYFSFKDVIKCGANVALVESMGKALLTQEGDEWWLYGVQPGGMAGFGSSPNEAFKDFRSAFTDILTGIATEASDLSHFEKVAQESFFDIDQNDELIWNESRRQLQLGTLSTPDDLSSIKKKTDLIQPYIKVIAVATSMTVRKDNDEYAAAA